MKTLEPQVMITGHYYKNKLSNHVVRCFGQTPEGNYVVTRGKGPTEIIYSVCPESIKNYTHEGRGLEDTGEDA